MESAFHDCHLMALTAMILTYVVFSKREKNTDLDSLTTFILSLDTVLKLIEKSICLSRKGNFTKIFKYLRTQKAVGILERNKVKESR